MKNYLKWGTWNVICDVCGQKYKSDEVKERWDGLMVCIHDYETRHPQSLIRIRPERGGAGGAIRTESSDSFISDVDGVMCTLTQTAGQADYGTADCARAGNVTVY